MQRTVTIIPLLIIVWITYGQENFHGNYSGALSRDGSIQLMSLYFSRDDVTYSIPECGLYGVPVSEFSARNDIFQIQFFYGAFELTYSKDSDEFTGVNTKWNPPLRIHLKKSQKEDVHYRSENIEFFSDGLKLSGEIFHPNEPPADQLTYVVLVHGSGAQNRYSPYYISIAHQLANYGFGVLLYDKRGTGNSQGNVDTATFEQLSNDAVSAIDFLANREGLNEAKIGFLGTSQGGWIISKAAQKTDMCDFLIFNVGPSVSLFDQDIHRVKYSMMADGWNTQAVDSAVYYTKRYFDYANLRSKRSWKSLMKITDQIRSKPWVNYINIPESPEDLNWWSRNAYDPEKDISNLAIPVLSIFGEYDVLVPPAENERKMKEYLKKAGVQYGVVVIDGVGHDMLTYHGLNGDNWNWPKVYWQWRKQPSEFILLIEEFLRKN